MSARRRARERRRSRQDVAAPTPPPRMPGPRAPGGPSTLAAARSFARQEAVALGAGALIVGAALVLYVATAARDIVLGDTPELTSVALTFGVAHPPGYPVFTMVAWVFGQLPLGPLPFRIALLSVVCHAATVAVVYAATYRFARSVPAAAVAAAALAFSPLFWAWSLVAEVFPLNDLLAATMLLLAALWHEHPERPRLLVAAGLVGGLGVANHQTIVLLAPAVFYLMWRRREHLLRDPRVVLNAAIAFVLGLVPYLELLVAASRRPEWSWGDLRGPGDLVAHFLRSDYGTGSLIVGAQFVGGTPVERIAALLGAMDPLQWLLLAVGTVYAWRARRWYATYLLIAFGIAGPAFIGYANAKIDEETTLSILERFFLMPHVAIAPLAGFAVVAVAEAGARVGRRYVAELAAAALGIAAAAAFVARDYRVIDQSGNHVARNFGEDLLRTVKPGALFMAAGDPVVYTVQYLRTVERERRDVAVVILPLMPAEWYIRGLRREYPDIAVTAERYGPNGGQVRAFIDANYAKRPIAALGDLPDDSYKGSYWFYSRGLAYDLLSRATAGPENVGLDDMTSDNEKILATYSPPKYDELIGPFRTWERLTLVDYASGYYRVGYEYDIAGTERKASDPKVAAELLENAKAWYRRALEIYPKLTEAREGLDRLSR